MVSFDGDTDLDFFGESVSMELALEVFVSKQQ